MAATKTLDILVAEMLGDIGKLHDQVAALKTELPTILAQMQKLIDAQAGKPNAPVDAAQRELRGYIREEIQRISDAAQQAKDAVTCELTVEVRDTVQWHLSQMENESKKSFDATAAIFRDSVTQSVRVVESKAMETLKGLCQDLKYRIDEIRAERWKSQRLAMISACSATGLLVGISAVWILR